MVSVRRSNSCDDSEVHPTKKTCIENGENRRAVLRPKVTRSNGPVIVRQMELRDAATVFHMGDREYSANTEGLQLFRTWDEYEVIDLLGSDPEFCLVAEEQAPNGSQNLVGFVLGSVIEKKHKEQSCGFLVWAAVASPWQRRGVGTKLITRVLELFALEGIQTVIVDTPTKSVGAKAFLEKLGFSEPRQHVYMSLNVGKNEEKNESLHLAKSVPVRAPSPRGGRATVHHPRPKENETHTTHTTRREVKTSSGGLKIRELEIDDLQAVYELGESVYDATKYPSLHRVWSEHEVLEWFVSDRENCFVAEMDKKVVGYCLGNLIEKKRNAWRYGYLVWMGVDTSTQRAGVGRKLFQAFYTHMVQQGARILVCDTQGDNVCARKFFEKQGFGSIEHHLYYQINPVTWMQDRAKNAADQAQITQTDIGKSNSDGFVAPAPVIVPHVVQRRMSALHRKSSANLAHLFPVPPVGVYAGECVVGTVPKMA